MKFQVLFFIFAGLFCACQISPNVQTKEVSNEANSNLQTNTAPSVRNRPENVKKRPVDVSRFSSVKIKRTDLKSKFSLKIDVRYPKLKGAKTPQEIGFNQYVKNKVDKEILDFTNFLADKEKGSKSKDKNEYEINLDYEVEYFSDAFASVLMNWNGFSGYLNMDYFPSTINFDLKTGKAIKLKDVFESDSKYLVTLSELSRNILRKTCLSCGCGNGINSGDPLPDELIAEKDNRSPNSNNEKPAIMSPSYLSGTEPDEENFTNWSIVANGLKITFGEYQIGPGCLGIIDIVIPFKDLQPILRKDLNFD